MTGALTTVSKLTISAWSASLGISRQAGHVAIKRCQIPVENGMVDADVATLLYRRGTKPRANPNAPAAAPASGHADRAPHAAPVAVLMSYDEARRRREAAEASIAELREAELRGELVRKVEVERALASRLVALRESLEVLADRMAALVAAESDAQVCRRMIRDEHRKALAAFAQRLDDQVEEEAAHGSA